MGRITQFIGVCVVALFLTTSQTLAAGDNLTIDDSALPMLVVQAQDAKLFDALSELAKRYEFDVDWGGLPDRETTISGRFVGKLDRILPRLLGRRNFIMHRQEGDIAVSRLVIPGGPLGPARTMRLIKGGDLKDEKTLLALSLGLPNSQAPAVQPGSAALVGEEKVAATKPSVSDLLTPLAAQMMTELKLEAVTAQAKAATPQPVASPVASLAASVDAKAEPRPSRDVRRPSSRLASNAGVPSPAEQRRLSAELARTVQAAQANLKTLMEGLKAACQGSASC